MAEILAALLPLLIVLACPAVLIILGRPEGGTSRTRRTSGEEIGPARERITQPEQEPAWWHSRYAEDFELWERGR